MIRTDHAPGQRARDNHFMFKAAYTQNFHI